MRLTNTYLGGVYVDGKLFTHPDRLMGTADNTRNKVLKQLRLNVKETLTAGYVDRHTIELHIYHPMTQKEEIVQY